MSDYAYLLEHLRQAQAAVSELESELSQNPGDRALEVDLLSAQRSARDFQDQLMALAPTKFFDVCRYRIVPTSDLSDEVSIGGVTGSLRLFQELFSLVYYAITSRTPRKTGHLPLSIADQSELSMGWTYSGSLGVVLTIDSTKTLFGSRFDETVISLLGLIEITNQKDVRNAATRLGVAPVRKAYEWANKNYSSAYDVDLKWRTTELVERGRYIARGDFVRMADNIGMTSDVETSIITLEGILAGGDIVTKRFHFVDMDDKDYRGILSANFVGERMELGQRYEARMLVETVQRYAQEEEMRSYTLLSLEPKKTA